MTTFDARERAFEDKFAHDAELQFKVTARRNKLFGAWAAAAMKLAPEAAEAYASSVVMADFEESGDDDIITKVLTDFHTHGVALTASDVRAALHANSVEARHQFMDAA